MTSARERLWVGALVLGWLFGWIAIMGGLGTPRPGLDTGDGKSDEQVRLSDVGGAVWADVWRGDDLIASTRITAVRRDRGSPVDGAHTSSGGAAGAIGAVSALHPVAKLEGSGGHGGGGSEKEAVPGRTAGR